MTCVQEVDIIVLQPSWEVHPLQPTLMWNLIAIPAVGSLRETAAVPGMLSLVLSEQQSSSTQRSEAELEPSSPPPALHQTLSPGPSVAELVLTASQSLLKRCLIF